MAYDGQLVTDLDVTRPDGDAEPKSILDDVTKEIKRAIRQTQYSWSNFQNQTGDQLEVGAVVSLGPSGLVASDVQGSFLKYVVVVETIVPNAIGLVAREGPVPALTAGPVIPLNYVRKSAVVHAVEDMNLPCTPTAVIPNGAIGFALQGIGATGLCNIFLFEQTSMFPISLANHVMLLTNRTGNILQAGESVTFDAASDLSVVNNDVVRSLKPTLIAFESIPNITQGRFVKSGVVPVVVNGNVSRNHYLRKSATIKALESTGTPTSDSLNPPTGSVGVALSEHTGGGSGVVQASMFGMTVGIQSESLPRVEGLRGLPNTTNVRQYVGYRAALYNPQDGSIIVRSLVNLILLNNINVTGRNGRDQSGTFNPSTYIYFYLTWDGTTIATRSSVNPPAVGPSLSSGETHYVFLDAVRTNTSSLLFNVFTQEEWSYYTGPQPIVSITAFNPETLIQASLFVPPVCTEADLEVFGHAEFISNSQGGYVDFDIRISPGTVFRRFRLGITGVSDGNTKRDGLHGHCRVPTTTQYLAGAWTPSTFTPTSQIAVISVVGYKNPR